MWVTLQSRDLCHHQTSLFIKTDSVLERQKLAVCTVQLQLHLIPLCEHFGPHATHTPFNIEKERDVTICPSSPGFNVRYRSMLESIGSHYLSSVTYLNCYGCDCFRRPGQLCVFSQVAEKKCLASPNKDISPSNKSMLTVCLHRLGDSPTLWFLIRHMMRRRKIGIWAQACCMGQTDLIVFAFHLPALMETILIHASHCHPSSKPSQVENTCISHSYFNKPQQLPYKDGRLYFLCWLNRMVTRFLQWKRKMMEEIIRRPTFALYFMK